VSTGADHNAFDPSKGGIRLSLVLDGQRFGEIRGDEMPANRYTIGVVGTLIFEKRHGLVAIENLAQALAISSHNPQSAA